MTKTGTEESSPDGPFWLSALSRVKRWFFGEKGSSADNPMWDFKEWPWPEYSTDLNWSCFEVDLTSEIMCAQASFRDFARVADYERFRIVPTYQEIGIKAFFHAPDTPMIGEHIFLTDIYMDRAMVTGTLNADSTRLPDLKEGQEVTVPIAKISDWFLVRDGKGIGGFTIPHVWSTLSREQQQEFRDSPPFEWFAHRGTYSAAEQLIAIPICSQCNKRNLDYPSDDEAVCAICRTDGQRCDCPQCGAPLIRNDKLPILCARCQDQAPQ